MDNVTSAGRLNLVAIESSLRDLQREFPRINKYLDTPRDRLDDVVVTNLLAGYAYVDRLVRGGVDPFALGQSRHLLELNALVLCGCDAEARARESAHLGATERHFYRDQLGGIGELASWYSLHRDESAFKRAAGAYIRMLSEPQLFIEGNHRTGALVMSYILLSDGLPPFVLSVKNAKAYFNPSTLISKTRKTPFNVLFKIPKLKQELAEFLEQQANDAYLSTAPNA
jgi:hypothetical protein